MSFEDIAFLSLIVCYVVQLPIIFYQEFIKKINK